MEVRRLRPSEGAAKAIVDVVTRVKHLETRPSGTIYVDDTIISVDPETGREIHFGVLPDGTVGFDPWVNDITPPAMPSTPKVTGTMGGVEVWWDGKEAGGTAQPDDYSHTEIEYSTPGSTDWTLGGTFTNANSTVVGNLTIGTTYHIRLISYDKNKNASEPSAVASGIPVSYVDNEDVENALEELRQSDRENASAAAKAQESAAGAHSAATTAGDAALRAAGIANGKGRVIYASTAPTAAEDRNANNLWVDTSGDVPKNTPHRWDDKTSKWVAITDKAALDAGIAAGRAEGIANAASAAAAAAAIAAGKAQTSANDKNRVWYLPTPPAGNDHKIDDTWFDTSNGNMIHRWTGTAWVSAQDTFIAKADKKAADAAAAALAAGTTADSAVTAAENAAKAAGAKGKVIIQNGAPDTADRLPQNLWIDTTGGANTPKRWNGAAWVAVTDKKATDAADAAVVAKGRADEAFNLATTAAQSAGQAQASADGKNRVWYSDTAPTGTGHRVGDTWFDASMDNMPKVWNGSAWISVQDKSIAKADKKAADAAATATAAGTAASNAATAADNAAKAAGAKGKVIIQSTAPDAADRLPQNLWIDTTGGTNTPKRWVSGTTWTAVTDKVAQDAANAAAAAQTKADSAFLLAGSAAESAGLAQQSADGKNKVWYSTTAPTGTLHRINDLWFDETNGNRPMRWNGSNWVTAQDASIAEAKREAVTANAAAAAAQGSANSAASTASEAASAALAASNLAATKGKVLAQATAPTGVDANAQTLWIDTSGTPALNTPKRWVSGTTWTAVTDKAATDAATLATSKGKVIIQSAAPATADRLIQNMWIDTTNGANTPKRWNTTTSTWDKITDKTATDAAAAAAKAQQDATAAIDNAAAIAITAGQALTSANGKATVRYTGTMPSGTGYNVNDVWFDSANGNAPMRWDGSKWASIQDRAIDAAKQIAETAKTNAAAAQTTADGKNAIYYQTAQPASTTAKPLKQGDMWFDTDDNYALHTYSGSAWVKTQDTAAVQREVVTAAQAAANAQAAASTAQADASKALTDALAAANLAATKGKVLMQSTAPTGVDANAQTLWIDTSGTPALNTPKRWVSGTTWVAVTDKAAADAASAAITAKNRADEAFSSAVSAATAAGTAQTSANAKARVWYNATAPAGTGHAVNDLWFDASKGNAPMRWNGTDWVTAQDAAIATAKSVADNALTSANGKNKTYYQATKPTGGTYVIGDTWFDTANNYALHTYTAPNVWTKTQDSAQALADAKADATTKADAAVGSALAAGARGANVVVNGSFEQGFVGWEMEVTPTSTNFGIDTSVFRTGTRSFYTTGKGGFRQGTIPVSAGQTWDFSFYYKTDETYAKTNAGGLRLQALVGGSWADVASSTLGPSVDTWSLSTVRYVVPTGVAELRARFAFNYANGAKCWIDDVALENVSAQVTAANATAAAILAAAADATLKKEQAEANAATEAARVATEKANAAQAAALKAANTYADAQASGAQGAALEAAKLDATAKANAAQKAAIDAAALDATAKKELAETNAALDAKNKADEALRLAKLDADTKVATKTKTWIQAAKPAMTGNIKGDTWIDSDDGNKMYVWNGTDWVSAQDTAIATAKSAGDAALTAANGKNKNYYQATKPTTGVVGDTWFDTSNNYAIWTHSGTTWVKTQDAAQALADAKQDATAKADAAKNAAVTAAAADAKLQAEAAESRVAKVAADDAKAKADAAQAAAAAAAKVYTDAQSLGVSETVLAEAKADATKKAADAQAAAIAAAALDATAKKEAAEATAAADAKNKADEALRLAKLDADTKVATKTKTWIQGTRPALTGNVTGDTWIDNSTAGGNKLNVWDGSAWVAVQDTAIATAKSAGDAALTAANGKNKIIFSTSDASGTTGYAAGDMWMKRDANGVIIGQWEFTTSWQKRTVGESVIGNLSAGKITSGTITADRIGANTIGVTKLSVADLTNLLEDPLFTQALPSPYWTGSITDITAATDHPTVGTGNTLKITGTAGIRDVTSTKIAASPGDEFYAEVWVKPLATGMKGTVQIASTVNLVPSGNTWPSFAQSELSTLTPNVWTKLSGSIKTPANAKAVFIRLSLRENVASGDVLFAAPALRRKNGGELLVDGAIKAGSAIIGEGAIGNAQIGEAAITSAKIKDAAITNAKISDLNAAKINAGVIASDRIAANSINATKLSISDITNLWPNQYFSDELTPTYNIGVAYTGTEVPPVGQARLLKGRDHTAPSNMYINARLGDSFVLEAVVKSVGETPPIRLGAGLWLYKSPGVHNAAPYRYQAASTVVATFPNGWERRQWILTLNNASDATATLGLLYFQIEQQTATAATQWLVSDMTIRRRGGGELIVDGAIKANSAIIAEGAIGSAQIGEAQITTAKIANAAITDAKIDNLNASKITAGTISADRLAANDIRSKLIAADLIVATDLLVPNSITATSGIIGSLDASVITTGYISASRIEAGSLSIGTVAGLNATVDAATAAKTAVDSWKGSDGKVNAANVTGTLTASVPGAKVTGTIPVAGVPAIPTSKVTNLDGTLATHTAAVTKVDGWTATGTTQINGGAIKADTVTAIQIAAKSLTSESGVFGAINAADITTGTLRAGVINADIVRNKLIESELIVAEEILVPGSITATNGIIGSIDAGKITAGAMDGLYIKANSIDTSKLLVGAIDNLVSNPQFFDEGRGWGAAQAGPGTGYSEAVVYPGMDASILMTQKAAGSANTALYGPISAQIPVNPDEAFYVTSSVYTTAASDFSSIGQRVYFYDASGGMLEGSPGNMGAGSSITEITNKTWVDVGGQVIVPKGAVTMTLRLTVYYPVGYTPSSAVFYVGNPKIYRVAGSTLIEKGAIVTEHITTGTLDGKVIKAQTISGSEIMAKTISTDNLLITSTDNLIQEADFGAKGIGWSLIAASVINASAGRNGGPALRITANSAIQTVYNKYTAAVEPGNVYRLTAWIKPSVALPKNGFTFMIVAYTAANAPTYLKAYNPEAIAAGAWGKVTGIVTVPETTATMKFALEVPTSVTSGTIDVDFASVTRAADGELIVEGAITTNSMKAGTIDGKIIHAGTIKGAQIEAKTITVDNMLISSTDNFIHEADFTNKGTGWNIGTGWKVTDGAGRNGGPALVLTNTSSTQSIYNKPEEIPMEGEQNIRLSAWVKTSVAAAANTVRIGVRSRPAGSLVRVIWDKPIAANVWTRVHGIVKLPENTATASFFIESTMPSGTLTWDYVSATRAAGAELIVDGSITTTSIVSSGLDASVIKAGTIDAARIGAQTITAEKLVIGQGANLMPDPNFLSAESNTIRASRSTGTWTFPVDSGTGLSSARTTTTVVDTRFHFGHFVRSAENAAKMIPAVPGEKYLVNASVYTNVSSGARWFFDLVYGDGTNALITPMAYETATGRRPVTHEFVVPAKVVAFQPVLQTNISGMTLIIDGGVTVAKKVEGNLIVDGALTGKTITGAIIQSVEAEARGIKLNASEFVAYNNLGAETLRLSGNTATITGATVQTAQLGARVVMNSSGLKAYPSSGTDPYFSATAAGLELTGTLKTVGTSTQVPGVVTSILGPTIWGREDDGEVTPGLGFYAKSLELQRESPPHIASLDGRSITLNGMQRTSNRMAARLSVNDNYQVNLEGDLLVTGRVKSANSAGMHWEWSKNNVNIPNDTRTGPGVPVFDIDQSPVTSHPNKVNLYKDVLTFNSAGEMIFKEAGTYLVDLKVGLQTYTKGMCWVALQQYGFNSQISYVPAGVLDMAVSGSFYFPEANMKLSPVVGHNIGSTVGSNWRIKVTLLN